MKKHFYNQLKNLVGFASVFPFGVIILIFALVLWLTPRKVLNPDPIFENWCGQIQTFDTVKKALTTYYNPVVVKGTEILSIQLIDGTILKSNNFLTGKELDYNMVSEITTRQGGHFKVSLLTMEKCKSKAEMDSLKKRFDHADQDDSDN